MYERPNYPALLSPKEVETIFGIPRTTQSVWRCTGRHRLPYLKVGRSIKYPTEAFVAWLRRNSHNLGEINDQSNEE